MGKKDISLKIGAGVVAFALLLRLLGTGAPWLQSAANDPRFLSFLVFLQTGRLVRYPEAVEIPEFSATEPTAPTETISQPLPEFSAEELDSIDMMYGCDYRPDLEKLLLSELNWDLKTQEPAVLIVHTHATESYTQIPGWEYEESSDFRTLDADHNMVAIGDEVARLLEEQGIGVLHDRSFHDEPSYNGSYSSARKSIAQYLEEYPSIQMVLDIHRDSASSSSNKQLSTHAVVDGQDSAQIMLVIGTDASGNYHPNWQTNLALALKLTAVLERNDPGICRPIYLRQERFNMDMTAGSLLVEMGAAGDTQPEVLVAAGALARAIGELAKGSA